MRSDVSWNGWQGASKLEMAQERETVLLVVCTLHFNFHGSFHCAVFQVPLLQKKDDLKLKPPLKGSTLHVT